MTPLPPHARAISRAKQTASRVLFGSTGRLVCAIGRAAGSREDEGEAILVVQLGGVGDLVLTSPFLRELGRAASAQGSDLVLVVRPAVEPIAAHCPYASRVVPYDARRSRFAGALSGVLRSRRFVRGNLTETYAAAWQPRFDLDELGASFAMLWSGAGRRVGYSEHVTPSRALRNHGYDCLLTDPLVPDPASSRHEADRLLGLLEGAGVPVASRALELWLTAEDGAAASRELAAAGKRRPVALGIGAGHAKRCWEPRRFARVAEHLYEESGAIAVLLGGPQERLLARQVRAAAGVPVIDAVGKLDLRGTAALVGLCDLYVGNDSGLLHIAAAAGRPVVEISCHPVGGDPDHPNSPERFGPHGVPNVVLRPPSPASPECAQGCEAAGPHCIERVAVGDVLAAAASLLAAPEHGSLT